MTHLALAPFDPPELNSLLKLMAPRSISPQAMQRIADLSGGNAFFAQELVAAATVALSDRGEPVVDHDALRPRLTVRERQVLDLTAAGLDLHQVAQRLFLTPGTVHEVLADATAKTRDVDDALK